jgi:hypothetical protein
MTRGCKAGVGRWLPVGVGAALFYGPSRRMLCSPRPATLAVSHRAVHVPRSRLRALPVRVLLCAALEYQLRGPMLALKPEWFAPKAPLPAWASPTDQSSWGSKVAAGPLPYQLSLRRSADSRHPTSLQPPSPHCCAVTACPLQVRWLARARVRFHT